MAKASEKFRYQSIKARDAADNSRREAFQAALNACKLEAIMEFNEILLAMQKTDLQAANKYAGYILRLAEQVARDTFNAALHVSNLATFSPFE